MVLGLFLHILSICGFKYISFHKVLFKITISFHLQRICLLNMIETE